MEEVKFEDMQKPGMAERATELAKEVVGLVYDEAVKLVSGSDCELRTTSQDGAGAGVTMDFRSDRINLDIVDGKVTAAYVG